MFSSSTLLEIRQAQTVRVLYSAGMESLLLPRHFPLAGPHPFCLELWMMVVFWGALDRDFNPEPHMSTLLLWTEQQRIHKYIAQVSLLV